MPAFLLALLPYAAISQSTLSGRVTGEEGEILIGATIYVENNFQGAITDTRGNYEIRNLRNMKYLLRVSYMGYESQERELDMKEDNRLDFSLERANLMAEEVIVTATRAGNRSPLAYSNIKREEIRERNMGQDIPMILSLSPSFISSSDAGAGVGYTSFRIRGTDMNRINVTINGIPLNDSESHGVWWVDLPDFAASVDNVQIQRGVGTSTNGGSAFGASMNFETFNMNPDPYGELSLAAGSFNTRRTSLGLGTGLLNERFTLDMRLSGIHSDGFIDRAFSDLRSFSVSGAWYGEKSLLKANVIMGEERTYQAWNGVPSVRLDSDMEGMMRYEAHYLYTPEETAHMIASNPRTYNFYTYEDETDNYQQDHYQLFYSREIGGKLLLNTGFHYTYGRGYYEQYKTDDDLEDYGIADIISATDTITSTDLARQKWLDNDFYGLIWSLTYHSGKIEAHLGGGLNRYDGRHFGRVVWARNAGNTETDHEWYRNNGFKRDWNTYLKVNYQPLARISLFGDLQFRTIHHEMEGIDDDLRDITQVHDYAFWNPKAGATFELSNHQRFAASVAVGHREPNRSNFVDADPALGVPEAETLVDYEMSYRLTTNITSLEANLYYMNYDNQLVLTGEINDVGSPVMRNIKDSYRAGIELVAGIIPLKSIQWDLNLTLSRNRIRNYREYVDDWDNWGSQASVFKKETELSFSPSITGGSKISYKPFEGLKFSLLSKYVGKQYIDNSNFWEIEIAPGIFSTEEHKLDPYFVNDFQVLYSLKTGLLEELSFHLHLNNVLNEQYETNAWIYKYYLGGQKYKMDGYFPQAGFHFMCGVTARF